MTFVARIMSVLSSLRRIVTVDAVLDIFSIKFREDFALRRSCVLPKPNQLAKVARGLRSGGSHLHHRRLIVILRHDLPTPWCERRWRALIVGELRRAKSGSIDVAKLNN